jgi:hypothetical protein
VSTNRLRGPIPQIAHGPRPGEVLAALETRFESRSHLGSVHSVPVGAISWLAQSRVEIIDVLCRYRLRIGESFLWPRRNEAPSLPQHLKTISAKG